MGPKQNTEAGGYCQLVTVQQDGIMLPDRLMHWTMTEYTGETSVDVHALLCVKLKMMNTVLDTHNACIQASERTIELLKVLYLQSYKALLQDVSWSYVEVLFVLMINTLTFPRLVHLLTRYYFSVIHALLYVQSDIIRSICVL